jgi:hypothetical protein
MSPLVRASVIASVVCVAIAQAAYGIAHAQPKDPLPHCHMTQMCTLVPAKTLNCPPKNQQTRPCNPQSIPAHKVCTAVKVCDN